MNTVTDTISIDDLDRAIVNLAARINAETYELLVLIRQFDERAGWLKWGLGNCAEWLHYRCDLSMNTAREKVRVAHALKSLPKLSSSFLRGESASRRSTSDDYLVTIHVDQSALVHGNGRSSLPIESVKRLCCDGNAVVIGEDENGEPLNIGRKTRTVPTAIKRALKARDKCCAFPGCRNRRFVDAHHIEHWSAGGETSLDNLMLLCSKHHTLVHEGGFTIQRDYQNRWYFRRPDGRAVPDCGYRGEDVIDEFSESINNPPAGGFAAEGRNAVLEPPPPEYHRNPGGLYELAA